MPRKLKKLEVNRALWLPTLVMQTILYRDIESLPCCCGVGVIGDFGSSQSIERCIRNYNDAVRRCNADPEHEIAPELEDYGLNDPVTPAQVRAELTAYGLYLATTTQHQKDAVEALQLVGFTVVETCRNPNTGNTITLWVYKPGRKRK